jgi:glutathione peroxidase-family protein
MYHSEEHFMKTRAVVGGIMAGLLALAAGSVSAVAAEIGRPAPGFTLKDLSGTVHSLSDFAGKIVVLEWTNPNCPFVRRVYGAGVMTAVQKQYVGNDIVWLAVNSTNKDHDDFESVESMRKTYGEWGAGFTALLLDADGTVGKRYDARTTPHMFIINAEGILVYNGAIDDAPRGGKGGTVNYVKAALDELRSGKAVGTPTTKPYGCSVKY